MVTPRRSVLYMPGSNSRALDKARTLLADALIFDLEDAVAPDAKAIARRQVAEAIGAGGYGQRELVIRINALESEWGAADLEAAADCGCDAILVPKVSSPGDIAAAGDRLVRLCDGTPPVLWAMMETPVAVLKPLEIAQAARDADLPFAAMVMGTNDLANETGAGLGQDRLAIVPWLMACIAAARAEGLDIVDGVYNDFRDHAGFEAECSQGALLGMTGKTLIHPSQIGPCNAAFSPSPEEVEQARRLIAIFEEPENRGCGAINLDGRMVERLHCDIARRTVALADAIAAKDAAA